MPNVSDSALKEMLKQLPAEQQKSLANIISGKISHQIRCMSDDRYETVEQPVLDDEGNQVVGDDGTPQTEQIERLVRPGCKGEVIAYLYHDGLDGNAKPKYRVEPVVLPDKSMKLRASRKRLDGHFGFQCVCGGDSRIAEHETGVIAYDGNPPTREGLETIYGRLQQKPADYPEIDGIREVDGFQIERVSS